MTDHIQTYKTTLSPLVIHIYTSISSTSTLAPSTIRDRYCRYWSDNTLEWNQSLATVSSTSSCLFPSTDDLKYCHRDWYLIHSFDLRSEIVTEIDMMILFVDNPYHRLSPSNYPSSYYPYYLTPTISPLSHHPHHVFRPNRIHLSTKSIDSGSCTALSHKTLPLRASTSRRGMPLTGGGGGGEGGLTGWKGVG